MHKCMTDMSSAKLKVWQGTRDADQDTEEGTLLVKKLAHVPGVIDTMVSYDEAFNDLEFGSRDGLKKKLQTDCQDVNETLATLNVRTE